jgi:hypothetical protein
MGEPDRGQLMSSDRRRQERIEDRPWSPWWRPVLLGTGGAALAYGTTLLLTGGPRTAPASTLRWLAGTLLGHDAVLAPIAVATGWVLWRATSRWPVTARRTVAGGVFVAACLMVVALPALLSDGAPDNPTATPRDYGTGLTVLLLADAAVTATIVAVVMARVRRRDRP